MNVLILTIGSRGDVQPYVALGAGLRAAGHAVTLGTSPRFRDLAEGAGLPLAPVSDEMVALADSPLGRGLFEEMGERYWRAVKAVARLAGRIGAMQRDLVADGWAAAQASNPDLIVYHPKMFGAPHYAEKLGVPAVAGIVFPQLVPTRAFPAVGFPDAGWGPTYNRLTYRIVDAVSGWFARRYAGPWRRAHGLPPMPRGAGLLHHADGSPIPVLHGFSPHVVVPPPDWPAHVRTTGYWFLNRADAYVPPGDLRAFLERGEPPVYIGFGSMAARDPERTTRIVLEALRQAGVRAVLATGWGGLRSARAPSSVYVLDAAPHDWLLPRCSAAVHHGGAGTTAAGLRAGCPTVICPFFGDQPFWGRRIRACGVGPAPISQKELTAEKLAAALREVTTSRAIRKKAEALGEEIRREDGVANAVAFVESVRASRGRVA